MTRLLFGLLLAALLSVVGSAGTASAALYCLSSPDVGYGPTTVVPSLRACVPGP